MLLLKQWYSIGDALMLKAFVLACVLTSTEEQCVMFEDTWGPYFTEENCRIRVRQMSQELTVILSTVCTVTHIEGSCVTDGKMS